MTPSEERVHIRWGLVIIGCIIFSLIFAILSGCGEVRLVQVQTDGTGIISDGDMVHSVLLTNPDAAGKCVRRVDAEGYTWERVKCGE